MTRVSGTSWDAQDSIGIYMVKTGTTEICNSIANYQYATTGDGAFSPVSEDKTIYYPINRSKVDFLAYYPYSTSLSGSATDPTYVVSNWASTRPDTLDLMLAKVTERSQADPEAELGFYHKFSRLILKVNVNSETGLTTEDLVGMTVSINGINKPATCHLLSQTVDYGEAIVAAVPMEVSAAGDSASAIIPSTSGTNILFTLADGETFTWDISNITFESGNSYTYAITLKSATNYLAASLTAVVNDWNNVDGGSVEIDGDDSASDPINVGGNGSFDAPSARQ